jgi:hypothetical protein
MRKILSFIGRFAASILCPLSCFDRVIFKGHLPFVYGGRLEDFVDYILGMRRKDFFAFAERQAQRLVEHAKARAHLARAPYQHLRGKHRKDKLAMDIARQRGVVAGLICVFCCMETCSSFRLAYGEGRPRFERAPRLQRVLYYYYLDARFGLMHVRIQTWFPFTVQVYVNGREWLAQQLLKQRIGFVLQDNAFTELDEPRRAQQLADRFAKLNWQSILSRLARRVNPVLRDRHFQDLAYYWVIDQAEYATDLRFTSRQTLAGLYPRLLNHAALMFSAPDILGFLGRRQHKRFDGEVLTTCKKDRWPGARIKHSVKNNWLKMYDKFGLILRVETVINNPREFKVRRERTRKGQTEMVWCPMNKGVCNLYRYQQVALAANARYLEALSVVDNPAPAYREVGKLVEPKVNNGRRYAGFNPARAADVRLFKAVLHGEHKVRGFRNGDIRVLYFGPTKDRQKKRRQSAAVTRLLKRLHVRGLIIKVPRSRLWHVTLAGHQLMQTVLRLYHDGLPAVAASIAA